MRKYDVLQEEGEEEEEQQQQQQQQQEEEEEQAHKCNKKMCGKMVASCGIKRTSHCALHLRERTEHMNNTNAHTTIHNPYGIAGVRSSTICHCTTSLEESYSPEC